MPLLRGRCKTGKPGPAIFSPTGARHQIGAHQIGASHLLRNVTSRFCEAICVDEVVRLHDMKMQDLKGRPPHRGLLISEQTAPVSPHSVNPRSPAFIRGCKHFQISVPAAESQTSNLRG